MKELLFLLADLAFVLFVLAFIINQAKRSRLQGEFNADVIKNFEAQRNVNKTLIANGRAVADAVEVQDKKLGNIIRSRLR